MLPPRLSALLGAPALADVRETHLQALIEASAAEDQDLDFKQSRYDYGPQGTFELAKDVAALANQVGGLIILGIAEDDQGRAAALHPVKLDDSEKGRIRQVIADRIFPMAPDVDVHDVQATAHGDDGHGYYLILVPRSTLAPHAVRERNPKPLWLCFPLRHGTTTHYQTETEIAARYRDRFALARGQVERLQQVHAAGRGSDVPNRVAIAVGLVPTVPGERPLTDPGPKVADFLDEWDTHYHPLKGRTLANRTIARRRLRAESHSAVVELHTDGAGWARGLLGTLTSPNELSVALPELEGLLVELLALLGAYAAWTGAAGDCAISLHIYGARNEAAISTRTSHLSDVKRHKVAAIGPAEATAPLDQLAGRREQVGQAAYLLARDLEQDMGYAAPASLQSDGVLKITS